MTVEEPEPLIGKQEIFRGSILEFIHRVGMPVSMNDIYAAYQNRSAHGISRNINHLFSWSLIERVTPSTVQITDAGIEHYKIIARVAAKKPLLHPLMERLKQDIIYKKENENED